MQKLSNTKLALYGSIAMPLALVGYPIAIWLPSFYASDYNIPLAIVAAVLFWSKITDVITDPLVGQISDNLRSPMGRRRPLILLGAPIFMLSTWLLFVPLSETVDFSYLLFCVIGMYIGTTLVSLPFGAWGAELSKDYHQRSKVTAWREFYYLAGLLLAAFIPYLVETYGDGSTANVMKGLALAIIVTLPVTTITASLFVGEPAIADDKNAGSKKKKFTDDFISGVGVMFRNHPMRIILIISFVVTMAEAFRNALSLFFMKSVIGVEKVGSMYFLYFIAGLIAIPLWLKLGKLWGKHRAFCLTMFIIACISVANYFLDQNDYYIFAALFLLKGACFGGLQFLPLSILADVIDVETAQTGKENAGRYFAFAGMASKIATAAGTYFALYLLSLSAFDVKLLSDNPTEHLSALRFHYALMPALFFVLTIILAFRFPLTAAEHAELRAQIEKTQK